MKSRKFDDIELKELPYLTNEVLYWLNLGDSLKDKIQVFVAFYARL